MCPCAAKLCLRVKELISFGGFIRDLTSREASVSGAFLEAVKFVNLGIVTFEGAGEKFISFMVIDRFYSLSLCNISLLLYAACLNFLLSLTETLFASSRS